MPQTRSAYTHLTIQPPNEDGACEIWAQYTVTCSKLGVFDTDGVIAFLYHVGPYWVWLNEAGHPTMVFSSAEELDGWLQHLSPSIDWAVTYRNESERGPRA